MAKLTQRLIVKNAGATYTITTFKLKELSRSRASKITFRIHYSHHFWFGWLFVADTTNCLPSNVTDPNYLLRRK